MVKSLYRGVFNLHNEIKREYSSEYSSAYSAKQATKLMVDKLADKQGVLPKIIWYWMKDHPNSYEVKLEIKWEEI